MIETSPLIIATHQQVVSDSGSVQLQSNGENTKEQAEESGLVTLDKTEEVVQDAMRIRVLETPINTRVVDVLAMENGEQSGNLFGPKMMKALSAEQVCSRMNDLLDNKSKYAMAANWFTVKLEEAEEDS